jgi:ankyrin
MTNALIAAVMVAGTVFIAYKMQEWTTHRFTPLHLAAATGNLQLTQFAGLFSTKPNVRDKYGWTPMHNASFVGAVDVGLYLVDHGADMFLDHGKSKKSAMDIYASSGNFDAVSSLVLWRRNNQMKPDSRLSDRTWINVAKSGNVDLAKWLLANDKVVTPTVLDKETGANALHIACHYNFLDFVKYLVKDGVISVSSTSEHGATALFLATEARNTDIVTWLLDNGADPNQGDEEGATPIMIAAEKGFLDLVELLTSRGAEVDKRTADGHSAFFYALVERQMKTAKFLVSKGADVDVTTDLGKTPLSTFVIAGGIQKMVKTKKLPGTADEEADNVSNMEIIDFLVKNGADLARRSEQQNGVTPFMLACKRGQVDSAKWIVENHKALDVNEKDNSEKTALFLAADMGHLDMVKWLVEDMKADATIEDQNGFTPRKIAENMDHPLIAEYLTFEAPQ